MPGAAPRGRAEVGTQSQGRLRHKSPGCTTERERPSREPAASLAHTHKLGGGGGEVWLAHAPRTRAAIGGWLEEARRPLAGRLARVPAAAAQRERCRNAV